MQIIFENLQQSIVILFAVVAALCVLALVIGNLFGATLSPDVFDLLKTILAMCLGGIASGGAGLALKK